MIHFVISKRQKNNNMHLIKTMTTTNTTSSAFKRLFIFSILFLTILLLFSTTETIVNTFLINGQPPPTSTTTSTLHTSDTTTPSMVTYPEWFVPISKPFKGSTIAKQPKIALVNMEGEVLEGLESLHAHVTHVKFERVSRNVTWTDLYPLWIDEEEMYGKPTCPNIPMPELLEEYRLLEDIDIVMVKLPCGNWSQGQRTGIRDVYRLQVSLVAAKLAAERGGKEVAVVFVSGSGCEPMYEMFRCDDLVWQKGQYWVYMPDVSRLQQEVSLHVGACQVANQPYNSQPGKPLSETLISTESKGIRQPRKEAYVTLLHSSNHYVCGAIALAQSILQTNTTKDLVLLADDTISDRSIRGLKAAGWKIKRIERVRCPSAKEGHYNQWNCSKLRIWLLTQYAKVMFIDADFLVLKNIDHFFQYPQLSAAEDATSIFNSGVMIAEPSQCFFDKLMSKRYTLNSYNGGDQGLLNEIFTWWHRITKKISFLKIFIDENAPRNVPDDVYMIHFVGIKPWICYRDYDCNWDLIDRQIFASDETHSIWWRYYDKMHSKLKPYCGLTHYMDDQLQGWRHINEANASFTDTHWKTDITDPRKFNLLPNQVLDKA